MSKVYMKKPTVVEAVQYTGSNLEEIIEFCSSLGKIEVHDRGLILNLSDGRSRMILKEDFVLKNKSGLVAILSPDTFNTEYMEWGL